MRKSRHEQRFSHHSSFIIHRFLERVTDGTRTRDVQDHNLALCQLSYSHHRQTIFFHGS